jgi:endonuclease YncB( thermonuclease family)
MVLIFASQASANGNPARVMGVTDGDTVTVLTADKIQVKIRLRGIDAPEAGQDFAVRAKQTASSLAYGKAVWVIGHGKDRYGRTIAEIMLPNGRSLNREMVGHGMAWWYVKYAPHDEHLARLEQEARAARRGLWAGAQPLAPWV